MLPPGSWAADGCRFSRADKVGAPVAASALLDGVGLLTLLLLDAGSTACALSLDEPAIAQGRCVGGVRLIMRIGGGGGRGSAPWESSPVHIEERSFRTPLGMLDTPIGLFGCASGGATSLLRPDKATSQHRQLPSRLRRLLGLCFGLIRPTVLTRLINQSLFGPINEEVSKKGPSAWVRPPILHSFPAPRGAAVVPPPKPGRFFSIHTSRDTSIFGLSVRMNATPRDLFSAACGEASIRSRASSRSVAPPG